MKILGYVDSSTNTLTGPGITIDENGMVYVGEWEEGYQHGKGYLKINQDEYRGEFVKNTFCGQGRLQ